MGAIIGALGQPLPFVDLADGSVSLRNLAAFMGASKEDLSAVLGKNRKTIERDAVSRETRERLKPIIYILKMLWEITGQNDAEIKRWLHEPLVEWRGISPMESLCTGNPDAVITLVERIRDGHSSGY